MEMFYNKRKTMWLCMLLNISVKLSVLQISNAALDPKKESYYDFDAIDIEASTFNTDIDYSTVEPETLLAETFDNGCECGKQPPKFADSGNVKERKSDLITNHESLLNFNNANQFIINGSVVQRGSIPWMVALTKYQHKKQPRWRVICGAVLLNEKFVLTSAHCIYERFKDTLEVVFNVDNATDIAQDKNVIRRKIQKFIIHPAYNHNTTDSDLALIELKVPLDLSISASKIRPVCLTKYGEDPSKKIGTVAGWGYTNYQSSSSKDFQSDNLRKISIPILTHEECLQTKLSSKKNVTTNMICTYEEGKDACINDSGSGLTVEKDDKSYIVGLVSWGVGCALKGYPGVFTKVSNFVPWIQKNIEFQGSCVIH